MRVFRIDVGTGSYEEVAPQGAGAPGALVWVDLDLTDITHRDRAAELASIALTACPPAYFELVARWHPPDDPAFTSNDFIDWDDQAVARVNAPSSGPRMVRAEYIEVNAAPGIEGLPELTTSFISLLAGAGWLLTTRGPPAVALDQLRDEVLADWRSDYSDGGDLGMLILRALSQSYLPALGRLRARLQVVEQAFVQGQEDPQSVTTLDPTGFRLQLLDLKWAVDRLSATLPPLLRPGEEPRGAWLDAFHAREAAHSFAARLEAACDDLADLREAISGAFALAASVDSSLQLERATETLELTRRIHQTEVQRARLAEVSEKRTRALQDAVTVIAAVLLGPGVIAAIYGALPSILDGCQELRGATMVVLMVGTGAATWTYLRHRAQNPA